MHSNSTQWRVNWWRRYAWFSALVIAFLTPVLAVAQTYTYTVIDIGLFPGDDGSVAYGLNAAGDVVGFSGTTPPEPFLYTAGAGLSALPLVPGHQRAVASSINDVGVIVGGGHGSGMPPSIVRWVGGAVEDLGPQGLLSTLAKVNIDGEIIFESPPDAFNGHAFLFESPDPPMELAPGWYKSKPVAINDEGQVAGYLSNGLNAGFSFRWDASTGLEDIGTVPGFSATAAAINVSAQIAGSLTSPNGNTQHVFRRSNGTGFVDLGGMGEVNVVGDINSRGDFVGQGRPTSGLKRAFVYTDEGGLQDLNLLVDPAEGWFLLTATGINDAGQICGYGVGPNHGGKATAFFMTPVTPVGPLAAVSISPISMESGMSGSGWVSLTQLAPVGGVTVTLSTDSPAIVTVPATIEIPQDTRHARFVISTVAINDPATVNMEGSYAGQTRSTTLYLTPGTPTGIGAEPLGRFRLDECYPNPFNPVTTMNYFLPRTGVVRLAVYDGRGRHVRTLVDGVQGLGPHQAVWDGRDNRGLAVSSGVYFARLDAGSDRRVRKLVLLK